MTDTSTQPALSETNALGFVLSTDTHGQKHWQLGSTQSFGCVQVATCSLVERGKRLHLEGMTFGLGIEQMREEFSKRIKVDYPSAEIVEVNLGTDGAIWVVVEFRGGQSSKRDPLAAQISTPGGLGGFALNMFSSGPCVQLSAYGHFAVGDVPKSFLLASLQMFARVLKQEAALQERMKEREPLSLLAFDIDAATFARGVFAPKAEDDAAEKFLDSITAFEGSLSRTVNASGGWDFSARASGKGAWKFSLSDEQVPVEVLESRELRGQYVDLEIDLIKGNVTGALEKIQAELTRDGQSQYLQRRAALLAMSQVSLAPTVAQLVANSTLPDMTLLSARLLLLKDSGDQPAQQKLIVAIGRELARQLSDSNELQVLELVLPEMLGDVLAKINAEKAMACYERVLECRGELGRVLRKMTNLAAQAGMTDVETALLERAAKVEEDGTAAADIHFRLAQIKSVVDAGLDVSIGHGLEALQADQTHVGAALLTTDLLVRKQKYHDALRILGQLFDGLRDRLTPGLRATLAWRTGRIWQENLGRMDLAKARFEQALAIDERHLGSLRALEQIYRAANNRKDLAVVLHRLYDHYLDQSDAIQIAQLKQELILLYKDDLNDPQRALQLVMGEAKAEAATTSDLDKILEWQESGMDWTLLHDLLIEKSRDLKDTETKSKFDLQIADLCRNKLERHDSAVDHYLAAMPYQPLDSESFEYLKERLAQSRRYDELAKVLTSRLDKVIAEKRAELLRELVLMPKGVSESDRDKYAFEIYTLDSEVKSHLQKRMQSYVDKGRVTDFLRLRDKILARQLTNAERDYWTAYFVEVLPKFTQPEALVALDSDLKALVDMRDGDLALLQNGIQAFAMGDAVRFLPYYLSKLLDAGVMPDLPAVQLEALLADQPMELARYHELLASRETNEEVAIKHLREAAQIYRAQPGNRAKVDNIMAEYLGRSPATLEAIEDFESVVEQTGSWDAFAKVLRKQLEFYAQDRNMQIKLLQRYGEVNRICLKNYKEALKAYDRLMPLLNDTREIKFQVVNVAMESNDANEELARLNACLTDEDCLQDIVRTEFVVNRLCTKHGQAEAIKAVLVPVIQRLVDKEKPELAGGLAEILLKNGVSTLELLRIAFLAAAVRRDLASAERYWLAGFPLNTKLKQVRSYIEDSLQVLQGVGAVDFAVALMRRLVQMTLAGNVNADFSSDILLLAGQFLRDKDRDRRIALAGFQQMMLLDKDDNRSWIPLYYLLKEFGDGQALHAHLNYILPQLERNQAPLKAYPITVESLESERERLDSEAVSEAKQEPLTQMSEVIKLAVAAVEEESPSEFSQMESSLRRVAGEPEPAGKMPEMFSQSFAEPSSSFASPQFGGHSALHRSVLQVVTKDFVDSEPSKGGIAEPSIQEAGGEDWRTKVMSLKVSHNRAVKTLDQAFATKIEKHLAVQTMCVLAGDLNVLKDWQWDVWRDIRKAEYALSGKERFPRDGVPTSINSDLHRLLVAAIPVLVKLFSGRYSLRHLQKKLGLSSQQLMKARVPLVWDKGLLAKAGFVLYKDRIRKHRFSAYNISGMGAELFFDGSKRELYLDESYYTRQPTSHLFHRVLGLLWTIKLQYFVPLSLDPSKQILPSLNAMREHLDATGLEKLKKVFTNDAQDMGKLLSVVDRNVLKTLFAKVPVIKDDELTKLVSDMQAHTYRLLLAETLDVVGIFESITDTDLLATKMAAKEIVGKSPHIADLIEFITKIKV